jgi:hypothetical protein
VTKKKLPEPVQEAALTKPEMIAALTRSPHGALEQYLPLAQRAANDDPDFFAHLIAWNHVHGEIRDAKVALPLIALASASAQGVAGRALAENALAHLADLPPRSLAKGLLDRRLVVKPAKPVKGQKLPPPITLPPFAKVCGAPQRVLRRLVERYLRDLEADRRTYERVALQHRHTLHELYAHGRVARPEWVGEILFHGERGRRRPDAPKVYPAEGTIFGHVRRLKDMSLLEAAGTITKYKIPFLIARGALGTKVKDSDAVLALIKAMSPTELVTNAKWLETLGVKTIPALRAAFEEALGKAAKGKGTTATLKTTRAADRLAETSGEDDVLVSKLRVLQEKQIDNLGTIEGDWLVLGDKSGSMTAAIEMAMEIAALLARLVAGRVFLILFDTSPRFYEVTQYSYEQLRALVGGIRADGGTSIGCGLQAMLERGVKVDGIAIVSDGGENTGPYFGDVYPKYCAKLGAEPNVYLYQTLGDPDTDFKRYCTAAKIDVQRFDVRHGTVDRYSLPDLVKSMRVGRYMLLDDILNTPLHTVDEVLRRTTGMPVLPRVQAVTA